VGGNLGGSLLDDVQRIQPQDVVVLELSSFMLEGLSEDRWSPHVAVVTNIAPNHLDWHGTFEDYLDAKQFILTHQRAGDVAVLGPGVRPIVTVARQAVRTVEETNLRELLLAVPGRHNVVNAHLASLACDAIGAGQDDVYEALRNFTGLPHRLEYVAEIGGARCYNDSKSTTPEATRLAVDAFEPGKVHLIAGGYDKGSDLRGLAQHARERCRALYTIGATGTAIARRARAMDGVAEVVESNTLAAAVESALQHIRVGEILLLSPGCASWDQFDNFEQRGREFREQVVRMASGGGS
jgi:UDP-N-acetylmuramoylalanine--D-glutamate ligase